MSSIAIGILGVIVLIVLLFLGMPVAISMFLVGFFGYALMVNFPAAMGVIKTVFYTHTANYALTTLPLFTLMGQFIFQSGISSKLYKTANTWLGRVPGGLGVSTEAACAIFAAMCGSSTATAATFATVAYPEMKKYNYDSTLAAGAITSGGTLGILIPPGTGFILYGTMTGVSVSSLFAGGILPGIVLACCYSTVIIVQAIMHPEWAPKADKSTFAQKLRSLTGVVPTLILFGVVMGGIFTGVFTANEGAAIGALGGFVLMVVSKQCNWEAIKKACKATLGNTAMIMIIVVGAHVFGYFLTVTRIPYAIAELVATLDISRYIIFAVVILVFIFLGCIMDAAAVLLLTVPIFYPVLTDIGFDPVWIGIVVVMMDEMGLITPPVGMNLFVVKGVIGDEVSLTQVIRGTVPHMFALLVALIIITIFPNIVLWLPNLLSA